MVSGQANAVADAQTNEAVKAALEFIGKDFGLSLASVDEAVYANAKRLIDSKMKLGLPLNQAVLSGVNYIIDNDEKFKKASELKLDKSKLETAYLKAQADAAKKTAEIDLIKAKTATELLKPEEIRARIAKAKRTGGGSPPRKITDKRVMEDGTIQVLYAGDSQYSLVYDASGNPAKPLSNDPMAYSTFYDVNGTQYKMPLGRGLTSVSQADPNKKTFAEELDALVKAADAK